MVINTNGYDVAFQPYVDGSIAWADNFNGPTIFNTNSKQTVFHYFNNDAFGIDFHGELKGAHPFEFYGMLKPEEVEALPVAKVFDQIGPLRYDKIAKLYAFRIRMISEDVQLPFQIFTNDQPTVPYNPTAGAAFEGIIPCVEFTDTVYEVTIPKNVNGTIFRFTFGGAGNRPFHRYTLQVKINLSGMQSDAKWVEVK
jgi:hypothetical protein